MRGQRRQPRSLLASSQQHSDNHSACIRAAMALSRNDARPLLEPVLRDDCARCACRQRRFRVPGMVALPCLNAQVRPGERQN